MTDASPSAPAPIETYDFDNDAEFQRFKSVVEEQFGRALTKGQVNYFKRAHYDHEVLVSEPLYCATGWR
jgi:hypothetical protein